MATSDSAPHHSATELSLNVDTRWGIAFVALLLVHNELHEIAHTAVGRLICGAWGARNFNTWQTACYKTPEIVLAPIAGLVWSYGLLWVGYFFLKSDSNQVKNSLGFCLVFATMPWGRLSTVAGGGGDEMVILRGVFTSTDPTILLATGVTIVGLLIAPPLYRAFRILTGKQRWLVFVGMFFLPKQLFSIVVLDMANPLLKQGVLSGQGVLGAPAMVNVWTGLWVLVLAVSWKRLLQTFVVEDPTATAAQ
jgi:hypothetical protein